MVRYGIKIEHSNGKKEFIEYQGKQMNIDNIEKSKDFYHNKASRIYLVKFDVCQGHYTTLEITEY